MHWFLVNAFSDVDLKRVRAGKNSPFINTHFVLYIRVDERSPQRDWHAIGKLVRVGHVASKRFNNRMQSYSTSGYSKTSDYYALLEGSERAICATEAIVLAAGKIFIELLAGMIDLCPFR